MDQIGRDTAIQIFGLNADENLDLVLEIVAACDRVYTVAMLMTGDHEQACIIQACTLSSAKTFLDFCEGPQGLTVDRSMRERVIDRQMMIALKTWVTFEPLELPATSSVWHPNLVDCDLQDLATALLKIPAAERLVYILRFVQSYDYERIDVLLNLGDPVLAHEAAYVALHMLREKLSEASN